jgi:hypothetical protein
MLNVTNRSMEIGKKIVDLFDNELYSDCISALNICLLHQISNSSDNHGEVKSACAFTIAQLTLLVTKFLEDHPEDHEVWLHKEEFTNEHDDHKTVQ